MKNHEDVLAIVEEHEELLPELCSLQYPKPYELLFSVRLAAQCTDERVNMVTPALFARFPPWSLWPRPTPPRWKPISIPPASSGPRPGTL